MTNFYIPISKGDTSAYVGFYSEILGRFMEPQFYLLDLDYLDEISSRARANAPADLKVTDGSLTCTVTGSEGERLFTSVPYFKGWTVTKNGQKIEPEFIEDCLMVIPLEAGNNEIVMKFHTPYLGLGIAVTVISLIALIAWSIIQKKNLGNKENRRK